MEPSRAASKVLFVTSGLSHGGGAKQVRLIQKILINNGVTTGLFTIDPAISNKEREQIPYFYYIKSCKLRNTILRSAIYISKLIKSEQYKVIVCDARRLYPVCKILSIIYRLEYINLVQNTPPVNKTIQSVFKLFSAKNVISVSEGTKNYLIKEQAIPSERITVIRNSSEPLPPVSALEKKKTKKQLEAEDAFIISCIAWFGKVKGQMFLLTAFSNLVLKHKNLKLLLMGYKDYGKTLKAEVNRLGLEKKVTFVKPDYGVEKIMSISDLLVLPSLREGLGIVILEGFSTGKTIVASDIPGINEVVKDGYNGLLAPAKDPEALEAAIEELITNDALRERLAKNAKLTYERDFSFEKYKQQIVEYFEKL